MRDVITGGAGYLGSLLSLKCAKAGHTVTVIDDMSYGNDAMGLLRGKGIFTLEKSITEEETISRIKKLRPDRVFHLASVVGDPECAKDPELAKLVNLTATKAALQAANDVGALSIFPSSCSVYGKMSGNGWVDESCQTNPVSLYAEQKLEIERFIQEHEIKAVVLRLATLHGVSPKMRFDLTVNEFVRDLHLKGEIAVYGEQFWRPYAHIHDVATVMSTHANYLPRNTPINVGSNKFNYRKGTLARVLRNHVGGGNIKLVHKEEDPRDYRVRFDYLEESVKLGTDVESTAGDIIAALNAARRAGLS